VGFHADNVTDLRAAFEEDVEITLKPAKKSESRPKNRPAESWRPCATKGSAAALVAALRRLEKP